MGPREDNEIYVLKEEGETICGEEEDLRDLGDLER